VLGFGLAALAEVPFNIMQMIVGSTIAIPLTAQLKKTIKEIFYFLLKQ